MSASAYTRKFKSKGLVDLYQGVITDFTNGGVTFAGADDENPLSSCPRRHWRWRFYTSIFKDSAIESISPMYATFHLNGVEFIAPNGGPQYKLTEAISFFVRCETQDEIGWPRIILSVSAKKKL